MWPHGNHHGASWGITMGPHGNCHGGPWESPWGPMGIAMGAHGETRQIQFRAPQDAMFLGVLQPLVGAFFNVFAHFAAHGGPMGAPGWKCVQKKTATARSSRQTHRHRKKTLYLPCRINRFSTSENRLPRQGKLMGKWGPVRSHKLPYWLKSIAFFFPPPPPSESSFTPPKSRYFAKQLAP